MLALLAALALAGCGNKGDLVRPGATPHAQHPAPVSAPAPPTSTMPDRPAAAATALSRV